MSRRCTICSAGLGPAVARERTAHGLSFDAIAVKFGSKFSGDAVRRHLNKCVPIITPASAEVELPSSTADSGPPSPEVQLPLPQAQLLADVKRYRKIVENLQGASYSRSDVRGAIAANKAAQGWCELEAALLGIVESGTRNLNVTINEAADPGELAAILARVLNRVLNGQNAPKDLSALCTAFLRAYELKRDADVERRLQLLEERARLLPMLEPPATDEEPSVH